MNDEAVLIRKIRIEEDEDFPKGTWFETADGELIVICPRCGELWDLTDEFIIKTGMTIHIKHGCEYKAILKLLDYR